MIIIILLLYKLSSINILNFYFDINCYNYFIENFFVSFIIKIIYFSLINNLSSFFWK